MTGPTDAITRRKRAAANRETKRLLEAFERHLNRSTEAIFIEYLNEMRPRLSAERFETALRIFREHQRT
jgi:hypothetical protein